MSGGSFEYLCFKEAEGLLESESILESMVTALEETGYAEEWKQATKVVLEKVRAINADIEALEVPEDLREVWRAMEWWKSMDTTEEGFKEALGRYQALEADQ